MSYLFSIKFSSKEILKRKSLHLPHNMCFLPYIILIQGILYQQHSIRKLLKTSLPSILNTLYCPNILVFPSNTLLYATPKFRQRTYFSKDMKAYSTSDPIIWVCKYHTFGRISVPFTVPHHWSQIPTLLLFPGDKILSQILIARANMFHKFHLIWGIFLCNFS